MLTSKEDDRIQAYCTDPILNRSFRGHNDTITSGVFNPNMKQYKDAIGYLGYLALRSYKL